MERTNNLIHARDKLFVWQLSTHGTDHMVALESHLFAALANVVAKKEIKIRPVDTRPISSKKNILLERLRCVYIDTLHISIAVRSASPFMLFLQLF